MSKKKNKKKTNPVQERKEQEIQYQNINEYEITKFDIISYSILFIIIAILSISLAVTKAKLDVSPSEFHTIKYVDEDGNLKTVCGYMFEDDYEIIGEDKKEIKIYVDQKIYTDSIKSYK